MFVTEKLNLVDELIQDIGFSKNLIALLEQKFINLEAMLLRAKVLREFSTSKVQYIIQSEIQENQDSLGFLFSPFILSNLNYSVIYNTPASETVLNVLKRYYQADHHTKIKIDEVLSALNIFIDLSKNKLNETDNFYYALLKALCRPDVSEIFLINDLNINLKKISEIEQFFNVTIHIIHPNSQATSMDMTTLNMRKLLFKNKDEQYISLCENFSKHNAQLLQCYGIYSQGQAVQLVEDMFYAEHIYEKLSVYGEYIQTRLQHDEHNINANFLA